MRFENALYAVICALVCLYSLPMYAADQRSVAAISDIHFNPFDPPELAAELSNSPVDDWPDIFGTIERQAMSQWGSDTNYALFASSLVAFSRTASTSDFAIYGGDFLVHDFNAKAAKALGVAPTDLRVRRLALDTTLFVGDSLARAFPDRPFIIALGNTDSECGDFRLTPGGAYLAGTKEMVRRLVGAERLADDFDRTYGAGGYYGVHHPNIDNALILVLNDVLWSMKYQDACGTGTESVAEAMMDWLYVMLERQKASGGLVWLVHHMPWGIDAMSTATAKQADCEARVVPFLREPYRTQMIDLLRRFGTTIRAGFGGHVHTDDFRVLLDTASQPLFTQKIVPAISPIYDQNPGFQIIEYDAGTASPIDLSTYYLANLQSASLAVPGDWRFEYSFSEVYDPAGYSTKGVNALIKAVAVSGSVAATYRKLHQVSHRPLPRAVMPSFVCSMTHLEPESFTECYCGG